jgi:NAD(P)-dependent dehydrogenase (short-subunit alcohol dehydrogenase family)
VTACLTPRSFPRCDLRRSVLRPCAQPAELAPVYVLLASDEASYVSGAKVAVTGGNPIL